MEEMEMKIIESSADPYITGHFHAAQKKENGKISSATLGQQGKYLKELLLHQSEYFINESGGNKKKALHSSRRLIAHVKRVIVATVVAWTLVSNIFFPLVDLFIVIAWFACFLPRMTCTMSSRRLFGRIIRPSALTDVAMATGLAV